MAAVRHIARKHGMYGSNNAEATQCDIIMEGLQDFRSGLKREDVQGSLKVALKKFGPKFERILRSNQGATQFLVGDGMTFGRFSTLSPHEYECDADVGCHSHPLSM